MTQPYQPDDPQQDPYQSGPQYGPQYQVPYQPYYPPYGPPPDHPQATTALVLGIIGIVVCQVLGPFAFYLGRKAMREIDASGGTLGGRGNAQVGFILGIVGMVMLAVGLLFGLVYAVIVVIAITSSAT